MRRALVVLALIAAPMRAQTAEGAVQRDDGPEASLIRARRESSNRAIAAHDSTGFAAILADSVIVMTSASARYIGRAVYVNSMLAQFRARPDVVYRRTPSEVRVFAPWRMASEEGTWVGTWTEPDGKLTIGGRYFAKWRRIGDTWFVESETYVPEHCTGSAFCARAP